MNIDKHIEEVVKKVMRAHYEPEHSRGQTCWCEPESFLRGFEYHIVHNEQRVILKDILTQSLKTLHATILRDEMVELEGMKKKIHFTEHGNPKEFADDENISFNKALEEIVTAKTNQLKALENNK